jgi:plastocyanin
MRIFVAVILLQCSCLSLAQAPQHDDVMDHSSHRMHGASMVMNENVNTLPRDCSSVSENVSFTVDAGTEYAQAEGAKVFGYSQHDFSAPPCSRITVTLNNKDEVRHQWMLHGLPRYIYPQGMFHIEANAGETVTGTFIVPSDDATYLVHCDISQHMEKGMKAQLVVGSGAGDFWSIPGVTADFNRDLEAAPRVKERLIGAMVFLFGFSATLYFVITFRRRSRS